MLNVESTHSSNLDGMVIGYVTRRKGQTRTASKWGRSMISSKYCRDRRELIVFLYVGILSFVLSFLLSFSFREECVRVIDVEVQ